MDIQKISRVDLTAAAKKKTRVMSLSESITYARRLKAKPFGIAKSEKYAREGSARIKAWARKKA